jgi:hypothetical protein
LSLTASDTSCRHACPAERSHHVPPQFGQRQIAVRSISPATSMGAPRSIRHPGQSEGTRGRSGFALRLLFFGSNSSNSTRRSLSDERDPRHRGKAFSRLRYAFRRLVDFKEAQTVADVRVSPAMQAVLNQCPKSPSGFVFTNVRTKDAYTVNGVAHSFDAQWRGPGSRQATSACIRCGTRPSVAGSPRRSMTP